jgi:hypothetical protein
MTSAISVTDIELLRREGVPREDVAHSIRVAEKALEIVRRIGGDGIDQGLVGRGALFPESGHQGHNGYPGNGQRRGKH